MERRSIGGLQPSTVARVCVDSALPHLDRPANFDEKDLLRGAYVLVDAPSPELVLIATGSEVPLAMSARDVLANEGIAIRVVSMPCTGVFDRQDASYRDHVLPRGVRRIAVEAGATGGWWKYVGLDGATQGRDVVTRERRELRRLVLGSL